MSHLARVHSLLDTNFSRDFDAFWFLHQPGDQHRHHPAVLLGLQVAPLLGNVGQQVTSLVLAFLQQQE